MHLPTEEGKKRRAPPRRHVNYSNMTAELRETVEQCYENELRSLIGRLEGADSPRAAVEAECGVSGLLALVIATIHRCEDRHLDAKTSRPSSGPRRFTESPWVVNSPEVHGTRATREDDGPREQATARGHDNRDNWHDDGRPCKERPVIGRPAALRCRLGLSRPQHVLISGGRGRGLGDPPVT